MHFVLQLHSAKQSHKWNVLVAANFQGMSFPTAAAFNCKWQVADNWTAAVTYWPMDMILNMIGHSVSFFFFVCKVWSSACVCLLDWVSSPLEKPSVTFVITKALMVSRRPPWLCCCKKKKNPTDSQNSGEPAVGVWVWKYQQRADGNLGIWTFCRAP